MTVNEIKDTLEPLGYTLTLQRRISHGTQLGYLPRVLVNVYDTGSYVVQRDTGRISEILKRAETILDRGEGRLPRDFPRMRRVSVPTVLQVLRRTGYSVKCTRRLPDERGTSLAVVGGAVVVVYDKGLFRVQGAHKGRVQHLLNEAFRGVEN